MSELILIRHSISQPDSSIPSSQWRLSKKGRLACRDLSVQLSGLNINQIISSIEPKAIETAQLTAQHLGILSEIVHGVHEHERNTVSFLPLDKFQKSIKDLFYYPEVCIFGNESANQTLSRYSKAINFLLGKYVKENIVVVSHGTAISLFVAMHNNLDGFQFWQDLTMPCIVRLSKRNFQIIETIYF